MENKKKLYKGKAIYQPQGRASEYATWACNFFTGCSNDCEYCYCKRGVMSHVWTTVPKLKMCLRNAPIDIFQKELMANLEELRNHGLLFSFTTDPMLPETFELTLTAVSIAVLQGVPVKILTKRTDWFDTQMWKSAEPLLLGHKDKIAFGFTLTGFDEKEPFASSNQERIEAMRTLHEMGFKTFASIEPVITPAMSRNMIEATLGFCDLYKVGLMSGFKKDFYNRDYIYDLFGYLVQKAKTHKIYLKDSFLKYLDIDREGLRGGFVNSDYNIFQ